MSPRLAHEPAALVAAGIGAAAIFASGGAGPVTFAVAVASLALAHGRSHRWALSRLLERPKLFTILGFVYLPLFFLDMALSSSVSPVLALVRLVVFLLAAEVLSGNPERTHRPILLGLLLLVTAAAETTEVWFALPLVAFALAATSALQRSTLLEHQPAGNADPPAARLAPLAGVVACSLALGTVIFFAIPRVGAGWGRELATRQQEASLETGLSESVSLGTVGRVKLRRRVAFKARIRGIPGLDPESIYWRARPYSRWTGEGWVQEKDSAVMVNLPLGQPVLLPGEEEVIKAGPAAEIEMRIERSPALVAPGRPVWVRTPFNAQILASPDGSLSGAGGRTPRRYEIGVRELRTLSVQEEASSATLVEASRNGVVTGGSGAGSTPSPPIIAPSSAAGGSGARPAGAIGALSGGVAVAPTAGATGESTAGATASTTRASAAGAPTTGAAGAPVAALPKEGPSRKYLARDYPGSGEDTGGAESLGTYLDTGHQEDSVANWAASVAPGVAEPVRVARAFVAELSRRPYSLDTRSIDPDHPIASFLSGVPAHCEYFASAMVIGLRLRGIPARVVGGYLGADRSRFGKELVVREARAHLWVEVHLPEVGWTVFDPTPAEGRVPPSEWRGALRDAWERVVLTWDSTVIGLDISDQADLLLWARDTLVRTWRRLGSLGPGLAIGAPLMLALAAALVLRGRRRHEGRRRAPRDLPSYYRRLLSLAARRGVRIFPGETAREFAARVGQILEDPEAVRTITLAYERERFGGQPPSAAESASIGEALVRLARLRKQTRATGLPERASS
jgi:hypothetical protein